MATSQEVKETYKSTLQDLTCNSKPHITVLTMLADENAANAKDIVEAIEEHLAKVRTDVKLPVLYLIDCIVKNVGGQYTPAFSANLDAIFTSVFQVVDEKTRMEMFKLRQTWNDVFPKSKLYALDVKTNQLDPAWPVTAPPPNIHFNPKFLNNSKIAAKEVTQKSQPIATPPAALPESTFEMQQQYLIKQKQLLELQQKKLELELLQTQVKLQEQRKKTVVKDDTASKIASQNSLLLKPEVAKQLMSDKKNESAKAMLAHINQKFPMANPSLVPDITPKNMMSNVRPPIRDPRLLRQAQQQHVAPIVPSLPPAMILPDKMANNHIPEVEKAFARESRFDSKDEPKKLLSRIPLKSKRVSSPTSKGKSIVRHSKSSSGSTSSADSPKKSSRSVSKSPSKSSGKYNKGSKATSRNSDKRAKRSDRRSPKKDKGGRNYRRDRPISISPERDEKKDVDLRVSGPPEKQARLGESKIDKDMGLRNSSTGNKRLSSEISEGPNIKKNRAERFDTLFGSEDVDLRKLPTADVDRPITPPPAPIISNKPVNITEKENTNGSQDPDAPPKLSLEVLRAKLANATNANKDYLQKSRLQAQAEQVKQRQAKKDDFLSADDEHAKVGKRVPDTNLVGKVNPQIDSKKSQEAKRKENEVNLSNMMTQPISDDEFDSDMEKTSDDNTGGSSLPPKQSRFEPRFNNDMQWRGKRGGPGMGGRPMRGRANPWIRPPLQHGNGPVWAVAPPIVGGPIFDEDLGNKLGSDSMAVGASPPPPQSQDDICMSHANIKSINIDGEPRDILFYGETAIAFMTPDDPREISFQAGQRRVSFDDMHSYVLAFNDPYRDVLVSKHCHRVRLGAPTREIYIDGKPHECFFGGPPICVELDGKLVMVKIDGPSPQVKIGTTKRTDLVAGRVNLIIDAKTIVPIFLDGRSQTFSLDGVESTLRFKDRLKTVVINDSPMATEFGGLPKGVMINGRKHFVRFSVLPKGVRPGYVNIRDMEGNLITSEGESSQDACDIGAERNMQVHQASQQPRTRKTRFSDHSPDRSPQQNILSSLMGNLGNNLDNLLSIASTVVPTIPQHMGSYQIEQPPPLNHPPTIDPPRAAPPIPNSQVLLNTTVPPPNASSQTPAPLAPSLNINDLFQKLVATGIVSTLQNQNPVVQPAPTVPVLDVPQLSPQSMPKFEVEAPVKVVHKPEVQIKAVNFSEPSSLKVRQSAIVHMLYSGMQCSSCGMRFPQENSSQYSQHLDWHFRQNRKGKTNIRKASSRRWYYSIADWNNYEEFEDLEEREKCYFDSQQKDQTEGKDEENEGEVEVPSVPADIHNQDPRCEVCQEKLEQFYNEEKEEWHLRNTIRVDDKTYHPLCYDDYQTSLANITADETLQSVSNVSLDMDMSADVPMKEEPVGIPGLDVPPDEPVILDFDSLSSASKPSTPKSGIHVDETSQGTLKDDPDCEIKTDDDMQGIKTDVDDQLIDADDDDVIINEVEPERIILDDYEFDENGLIAGVVVKQEPIDDGFTDIENFHLSSPKVEEPAKQDESFMDIGEISEPGVPTSNNNSQNAADVMAHKARSPLPDAAEGGHTAPASPAAAAVNATAADCVVPEHTSIAIGVGGGGNNNEPLLAVPSIDGNLDCNNAGVVLPHVPTGGMGGKIKINISKPLPVIAPKENKDNTSDVDNNIEPIDPNQPLPPGEEPVLSYMKPALQGIDLKQLPPVNKGSELTGLCSIM